MKIYKNAVINGATVDFGVENGRFAFVGPTDRPGEDLQGREVIPGLIDIHSHGCVGRDAMDGPAVLNEMSRFYLRNGVTAWYPTTMSAPADVLAAVTAQLPACDGAVPLGFHVEGPFIDPAHKGAQAEAPIRAARLADAALWHNVGLMTVAPEFPGVTEAISGWPFRVCLGHTGCDYETALAAFSAGAVCVTHLFNAMPALHHRAPGLIGAAVQAGAYVQVIADGLHLHPATVLLAYRLFGPDRMILISDSMRAAGLNDGVYDLGGQAVTVRAGKATLADGTLAGSTATVLACVKNCIAFGIPKADALRMATATPAAMMGLNKGTIAPGKDADFVVMDQTFTPVAAAVGGRFTRL